MVFLFLKAPLILLFLLGFGRVSLKNRKVVEKGACISISNGLNVEIWNSPWIPSMPSFKPVPNANLISLPDFCVSDLIFQVPEIGKLLLQDLFDPATVQCIGSIHLAQRFLLTNGSGFFLLQVFFVKSAHEASVLSS
jgi:hypothetical protein